MDRAIWCQCTDIGRPIERDIHGAEDEIKFAPLGFKRIHITAIHHMICTHGLEFFRFVEVRGECRDFTAPSSKELNGHMP